MRVICIENSLIVDEGEDKGKICAHKGSIYHVINEVDGKELREKCNINFSLGAWYEFLEIDGLHHHSRFIELPDDLDDIIESIKEETKYNKV